MMPFNYPSARGWVLGGVLLAGLTTARPAAPPATAAAPVTNAAPAWLTRPLGLTECVNIALDQNAAILKSKRDLEATYGVVIQTRAIALPKIRVSGSYTAIDPGAVDTLTINPPPPPIFGNFNGIIPGNQNWSADIRLVQSIYEGGRIRSALRTARLTQDQALLQHKAVVSDTTMAVRIAYYDVLLAAQEVVVSEASLELLQREQDDAERRFQAGTVPSFNVLRAKVEVANARPRLIRARNAYRIAKNNLSNLLGYHLPTDVWEDIPLRLSGSFDVAKLNLPLPAALAQALEKRPELQALRKAEALRQENVVSAKAGRLPSVQAYGGYASHNSAFTSDLTRDLTGWETGVLLSWDLFDGRLTEGKVYEARALLERARIETDDTTRQVELEVRTAYSNLLEAWEVLESQKEVQEQAQEALRLAQARSDAGTGTQLDVLSAQTALTEARTTQVQAEHDYAVAGARFERAIGAFAPDLARPKP